MSSNKSVLYYKDNQLITESTYPNYKGPNYPNVLYYLKQVKQDFFVKCKGIIIRESKEGPMKITQIRQSLDENNNLILNVMKY